VVRCVLRTMPRIKNCGGSQNRKVVQDTAYLHVKAEKMFVRKIETKLRTERRDHGWNIPVESSFSHVHDSCCCHIRYEDVEGDWGGRGRPYCCCGVSDYEIESDIKKFGLDDLMGICGKGYWRLALGQYIRGRQRKEPPISAVPNLAGSSSKRARARITKDRGSITDQRSESRSPKRTRTQNAVQPDPSVSSASEHGHIPAENADDADYDSEGSSHIIDQNGIDEQLLSISTGNIAKAFGFRVPGHVRKREDAIWFCLPCTEIRFEETCHKTRKAFFDYNEAKPVFLQIDARTCNTVCSKCDELGQTNFPTKLPSRFPGEEFSPTIPPCKCAKAFFAYVGNYMTLGEQNDQHHERSTIVHYLMKWSPPLIGMCETRYTGVRVSMYVLRHVPKILVY